MTRPVLRIFHGLARSGGTLVSRCIGCMQGVALLSEIHPWGTAQFNPVDQARAWYGIWLPRSLDGHGKSFVPSIVEIEKKCSDRNLQLVIRDWAHLDFMGVPFVASPPGRSVLADQLAGPFDLRQIALVRHPVGQWLSLRQLALVHEKLDLASFLRGYRAYAEWCRPAGFVRYEGFTRDPTGQMKIICERLNLEFDPGFMDRWAEYRNVTGDVASCATANAAIRPPPRPHVDAALLDAFRQNDDYRAALAALGYSDALDGDDGHSSH